MPRTELKMWIGLIGLAFLLQSAGALFGSVDHISIQAALTSFKDQCLTAHNKYRAIHQAPPVKWSSELEQMAITRANYLARENKAQHESHSVITDNLFLTGNRPSEPCKVAVDSFYSEVSDYDYNKPLANWAKTGHFTQVVWKATSEIGAAQAVRNDSKLIVVIKYKPGGNILIESYFNANVLPPLNAAPTISYACVVLPLMSAAAAVFFGSF